MRDFNELMNMKEQSVQYNTKSNLRMGKTVPTRQGKLMDLYHFFINTDFK